MKITKSQLKEIIMNELKSILREAKEIHSTEAKVGDYLSIRVGDYAEDTLVEVFESPPEIGHKDSYTNLQCIAQIIEIAERNPEDY